MASPATHRAGLRLVRRTFSQAPLPVRLHVLGRYLTCPMRRVLEELPAGARVLDVGAGHGTFARLAVEAGAAEVVAVEPDRRKLLPPPFRHPRVRFVLGFDDAVRGPFDAVTLLDVLYRFPLAEWDPLLRSLAARLAPGGVLLIKELDPEHRVKQAWNRWQERISDAVRLTLGTAFSYEGREALRARFDRAGLVGFSAIEIGRGYPHAHILYRGRKAL